MAENGGTEFASAGEVKPSQQLQLEPSRNMPFLSLIPKFQFSFPFANSSPKAEKNVVAAEEKISNTTNEDSGASKLDVVRFPVHRPEVPPLKLENEEDEHSSSPLVLWQVYALGGFMIGRWLWAKWQERKAKTKRPSNNEDPANID